MRISKKLKIIAIVLAIICLFVILLSFYVEWFIKDLWFYIILIFISFFLLSKALILNSDSSFWLFCALFFIGIFGFINYFLNFTSLQFYSSALLFIPFSSIIVFILYANDLHFYIFIHAFLVLVPIVLYAFSVINFYIMVAILLCCVIILTILNIVRKRG